MIQQSAPSPEASDGPLLGSARRRVLIAFAHPAFEKSRVNRRLVAAVKDLEGVTFHDLYQTYPDFDIDVEREQQLLIAHDLIVLQHPFFWYSTPALLKEWEDLVLEHGWAYGTGGTALAGKQLLIATTTGGREEAYRAEGSNRFTMRQLLAPLEQTAHLCGMEFLPPFVVHGCHGRELEQIDKQAADYRRVLEALRDRAFDLEIARDWPRLNIDLERLLGAEKGESRVR